MYEEIAAKKFKELQNKDDYLILAIESSCDETSAAVTRGRDVLSLVIASQIEIHKRFGGVVPEIASRNHVSAIRNTVDEALKQANVSLSDISAVAVTYGAGLLGALLVGVSYAKALAYAMNVPLIKVNHVRGHISANYIADKSLEPPYLCLLASGGHTAIVEVVGYDDVKVIGTTQDDAVGEAFDKVARVLGVALSRRPGNRKTCKRRETRDRFSERISQQKHPRFQLQRAENVGDKLHAHGGAERRRSKQSGRRVFLPEIGGRRNDRKRRKSTAENGAENRRYRRGSRVQQAPSRRDGKGREKARRERDLSAFETLHGQRRNDRRVRL